MAAPFTAALSATSSIGRYFSVVSTASSMVLVVFVAGVVGSGAFTDPPSVAALGHAVGSLTVGDAVLVVLASLVVGLMLHPLQYAMVQVFEGYWGARPLAVRAMAAAASAHAGRHQRLRLQAKVAESRLDEVIEFRRRVMALRGSQATEFWQAFDEAAFWRELRTLVFARDEARRILGRYPDDARRILPTALGNRIRASEDLAGRAWGIDPFVAMPHIRLVAQPRDDAYVEDSTIVLDIALRFCLVWILCTIVATVAFWRYGPWLCVPATTYVLALLSYRGATVAAGRQGAAIRSAIDLNRFALYERLGLKRPTDARAERRQNKQLMRALSGSKSENLRYGSPPASPPTVSPPPGSDPSGAG